MYAAPSIRQTPGERASEPGAAASQSKPHSRGADGAGVEDSRAESGGAEGDGEDKENDAAAVTAVIWKELAELSAAQAKLKVGQRKNHSMWCRLYVNLFQPVQHFKQGQQRNTPCHQPPEALG